MRRNICKRKYKGWTLIYVLVISSIITLEALNLTGSFERKNFYIENYKESIINTDIKRKKIEYLMNEFNNYIEDNLEEIKEKTISVYFNRIRIEGYLMNLQRDDVRFNGGCIIKYDAIDDVFQLVVEGDIYDFYPEINGDKITYKFEKNF